MNKIDNPCKGDPSQSNNGTKIFVTTHYANAKDNGKINYNIFRFTIIKLRKQHQFNHKIFKKNL